MLRVLAMESEGTNSSQLYVGNVSQHSNNFCKVQAEWTVFATLTSASPYLFPTVNKLTKLLNSVYLKCRVCICILDTSAYQTKVLHKQLGVKAITMLSDRQFSPNLE